MSEERLIDCPFCGSDNVSVTRRTWTTKFAVYCPRCSCVGPEYKFSIDAAIAWNTRSTPTREAAGELLEALEDALGVLEYAKLYVGYEPGSLGELDMACAMERAEAAILKAKGETP